MKHIKLYEDFEVLNEASDKFLFVIGDNIIGVGSKESFNDKWKAAEAKWKESGGRPSLEPGLWKYVKGPKG
jgi:hypothetical protein